MILKHSWTSLAPHHTFKCYGKKRTQAKERVAVIPRAKQLHCCSLSERGSNQQGTPHPSLISRFSFFSFFFSPLSSVHHCCQTIWNLFSISHLFINSTAASARRASFSLLEQVSSTALAHYSHDNGRKAKSATSAYQDRYSVLVNSNCHLDTRWPYSSSILHWPSDATVMTARVRTWIQSLAIPAKASPFTALQSVLLPHM